MGERQRLQDALDESLRNIEEGCAPSESIPDFEELASELEPLLEVAGQLRDAPRPTVDPAAFSAGMERMLAAAAEERRPAVAPGGIWRGLFAWWNQAIAFRFAFAAATVLVILVVGALLLPSWLGASISRTATLSGIDGGVEILFVGEEAWRPAVVGDQVGSGDRLRTAALSAATLSFFDGSVTQLAAETEITLAEVSSRRRGGGTVIVIHQWIGQTHTRVHPLTDAASRFAIETLTAVAAVRGTEFFISVEADGSTWVRVAEGLVDVVAEGFAAQVTAGEELSVHPAEPRFCVTPLPTRALEPTSSPEDPLEGPTVEEKTATPTPTPTSISTDTPSPSPLPTLPPTPVPTLTPLPIDTPLPLPPTPTSAPQLPPPTSTPIPAPTATPIPPTPTWEGPPSPSP